MISSASHLGLFRRCGYPVYKYGGILGGDIDWNSGCGYYPSLTAVPHWSWRVAVVLLVFASCLLVFLACFVICAGMCTPLLRQKPNLCKICSYLYLTGGKSEILC